MTRKIRRYTTSPLALALYDKGLTLGEWCKKYAIQTSGLSRVRTGHYRPSERYVVAIMDAIGCDRGKAVELLLSETGPQGKAHDPGCKALAIRLYQEGMPVLQVAAQFGVSYRAVYYWLLHGPETRRAPGHRKGASRRAPRRAEPIREVARLRKVMRQAAKVPNGHMRIANEKAYESLRKIHADALSIAWALKKHEQVFISKLEGALEHYQLMHRLERVAA